MDYSQLSDFEINVAVFEAIHNGSPDYKEGENGDMVFVSFEGDIVNGDAVEVEVERGSFNPCVNPADAWPIITENNISIILDNPQCRAPQTTQGTCLMMQDRMLVSHMTIHSVPP